VRPRVRIHFTTVMIRWTGLALWEMYEALGQLGQDDPASGWRWSHCSAPLLYIGQMSLDIARHLMPRLGINPM